LRLPSAQPVRAEPWRACARRRQTGVERSRVGGTGPYGERRRRDRGVAAAATVRAEPLARAAVLVGSSSDPARRFSTASIEIVIVVEVGSERTTATPREASITPSFLSSSPGSLSTCVLRWWALQLWQEEVPVERRRVAARTAGDIESRQTEQQRHPGRSRRRWIDTRSIAEQVSGDRQCGRHLPRCEEPAVADLDESSGKDVEPEAAEKFFGMERHRATVLGPKRHGVRGDGDEALI